MRSFIVPREPGRREAALVAIFIAALAAHTAHATEIRVRPALAAATVAPREAATFSFQVGASSEDTKVRVTFGDFDLDDEGRFVAARGTDRSCAAGARADRVELDLRTRSEAEVRVRVDAPGSLPGTYWCLITFEADAGGRRSAGGGTVQVVPRISVPVLVTVTGGAPAKVTAMFTGSPERRESLVSGEVTFHNDGDAAAAITGAVSANEAGSAGTVEVARLPLRPFLLLPGRSRRLALEIPVKSALPVKLRAELEYGEGRRLELESAVAKSR